MTGATRRMLGGRSVAAFLSRHWQKQALLIRAALPDMRDEFTRDRLMAIACRDDVEARLIVREQRRYRVAHGPFGPRDFKSLPTSDWTLLVHGVNRVDDAADALLRRFSFIPFARLDDVMVSYAAPGGGVGPHFDSYDVFLLQGSGRRRWRYGRQTDLALVANVELKILRRFAPQYDVVLERGDMLYLPPRVAHDGTAVDACTTYSIGFRASTHEELTQAFLDHLRDDLRIEEGRYADPAMRPTRYPARIDAAMRRRVAQILARIRWTERDVGRFLGRFLSEPKPDVRFQRPRPAKSSAAFAAQLAVRGVALDRAAMLLYDNGTFYLNGDALVAHAADARLLRELANRRLLSARECRGLSARALDLLYEWYRYGFVHACD